MAKQEFVAGDQVWPTLRRLAQETLVPKRVASAYLGDGAGELLRLGKGDVLVVALSEANAKNGSVSPREIGRLMDLGVKVFTEPQLHAKVYLFGDVLAVGSPNLSSNSVSALEEAMLVSREPKAVRAAGRWFKQLCSTPVTPAWLHGFKEVYKPPRRVPVAGRLWLTGVSKIDFPEAEQEEREVGEAEAEESVRRGYFSETLRFRGSSLFVRDVKRGDYVIQVWSDGRGKRVYPHAVVVGTRSIRNSRGTKVLYVYLESPVDPRTIAWSTFKRGMAEVGVRLGRDVGTRELKNRRAVLKAKELSRCLE